MDYLLKCVVKNSNLRLIICDVTNSVKKIVDMQKAELFFAKYLADSIVASSLLSSDLIDQQMINLILKKNENTIIAEANSKLNIRGFIANPQYSDDLNVIFDDFIYIKDLGLKEKFSSRYKFEEKSFEENLNKFFKDSEQIPIKISLEVSFDNKGNIDKALGTMLTVFPNYNNDDIERMNSFENEKEIENIEILEKKSIQFKCGCNTKKIIKTLSIIDKKELENLFDKDFVEVECNFCRKKYKIRKEQLKDI